MADTSILHTLSDSLSKKLGELVMVAMWAGGGALATYVWKLANNWWAARQLVKQSHPLYVANQQIELDIAADRICQWAGAAHTSIYRFDHGKKPPTISMVGEGADTFAGRRYRMESQDLSTAAFPYLMQGLKKGRTWLYRDECEDYELNQYMRARDYSARVVLLLEGKSKDDWAGLLVISWQQGRFTDEHIPSLTTLEEHRRMCAFLLAKK